jgi:hypothetical protein
LFHAVVCQTLGFHCNYRCSWPGHHQNKPGLQQRHPRLLGEHTASICVLRMSNAIRMPHAAAGAVRVANEPKDRAATRIAATLPCCMLACVHAHFPMEVPRPAQVV